MEPIEKMLEKKIYCTIIRLEGIEAIGIKPTWNWLPCNYSEQCALQEFQKRKNPRACLYNPKMFKCPAYHYYSMPLLLSEKNEQ